MKKSIQKKKKSKLDTNIKAPTEHIGLVCPDRTQIS